MVYQKYEGHQQQPIVTTLWFMDQNQSSDGSMIPFLPLLKTKIHRCRLQCTAHFKQEF